MIFNPSISVVRDVPTYLQFLQNFVHPKQDVALCISSSFLSLLLLYSTPCHLLNKIIVPSLSFLSSSWSFPIPWLPVSYSFFPSIVIHSCNMASPFLFLFSSSNLILFCMQFLPLLYLVGKKFVLVLVDIFSIYTFYFFFIFTFCFVVFKVCNIFWFSCVHFKFCFFTS